MCRLNGVVPGHSSCRRPNGNRVPPLQQRPWPVHRCPFFPPLHTASAPPSSFFPSRDVRKAASRGNRSWNVPPRYGVPHNLHQFVPEPSRRTVRHLLAHFFHVCVGDQRVAVQFLNKPGSLFQKPLALIAGKPSGILVDEPHGLRWRNTVAATDVHDSTLIPMRVSSLLSNHPASMFLWIGMLAWEPSLCR